MTMYRTTFERLNFGVVPPLKQTADVVFETDIPFDDDSIEAFESVVWAAMWEQNPHWLNPAPPTGVTQGWSSVSGGHDVQEVDVGRLEALVWYIPEQAWLKADCVSTTIDPDEAGRFSNRQVLELQARYPGERHPLVIQNRVGDLYGEDGKAAGYKLEIRRDEFVFWGYGESGRKSPRLAIANEQLSFGSLSIPMPFELSGRSVNGEPAVEYERRVVWAWLFSIHGYEWTLADSPEGKRFLTGLQAGEESRNW